MLIVFAIAGLLWGSYYLATQEDEPEPIAVREPEPAPVAVVVPRKTRK